MASSYAVISWTTDLLRGTAVPVGVALWSAETGALVRLLGEDEAVPEINDFDRPFLHLLETQLRRWIASPTSLPWLREPANASHDAWWRAARKALVHRTSLTEPRAIGRPVTFADLDVLFKEIVRPARRVRGIPTVAGGPQSAQGGSPPIGRQWRSQGSLARGAVPNTITGVVGWEHHAFRSPTAPVNPAAKPGYSHTAPRMVEPPSPERDKTAQ